MLTQDEFNVGVLKRDKKTVDLSARNTKYMCHTMILENGENGVGTVIDVVWFDHLSVPF